jgi:hypothetical protein
MKIFRLHTHGSAILPLIITLPFLILTTTYFMSLAVSSFSTARKDQFQTHAQFASDGGLDVALQEINQDEAWSGTAAWGAAGPEEELHNDGNVRTTYEVVVTAVDDDTKVITSTGRTYSPISSATPRATVKISVNLRGVSSGDFSIVTGVGGLYMSNSAKILGGDVFVNGEVNMTNSSQIGLLINPVRLQVAHQNCPDPADATYPRLCNSGENGQPITISNPAHIYGEVRANNQTDGSLMSLPGLVASSGVAAQALPVHDRVAQKAAATNNMTGAAASCTSNGGTVTWPANTKITGDVTISKNGCTVTIEGDVWITGSLTMINSGILKVSNALGTTRANVMVDGTKVTIDNTAAITSNSSGTGLQIITYRSTASCSPDCVNVTGLDLYNSRSVTTIDFDNSASGPHTIFYARWSKVSINNSGSIGALVGQTIELKNSGAITFGTSAGVGTTSWIIDSYNRDFN